MTGNLSRYIDTFSRRQGEVSSLLALPLLVVVVYEVIMRYAFNAPTTWGFELTTFLYGVHYMLGLSYTDVLGGHVRVDIFTARMPGRVQAVLGVVTSLLFFLPVMAVLTWVSLRFAAISVAGRELNSTSWAPPIYPIKVIMAVSFLFLLIQGVSNLLHNIDVLRGKREGMR